MVESKDIPLSRLYVRQDMDRTSAVMGTGAITKLIESIEKVGLISPLRVQATKQGKIYRVFEGSLRLNAMRQICQKHKIDKRKYMVPCIVDAYDPDYEKQIQKANEVRAKNLFPWQERLMEELEKKKGIMFAVSTPGTGKTFFDFENQNIPVVHKGVIYDECCAMPEKRSWRIGHWPEADWASFEIHLMAALATKPAKVKQFDLGDQW